MQSDPAQLRAVYDCRNPLFIDSEVVCLGRGISVTCQRDRLAVGAFDLPGTSHTRCETVGLGRERTGCTVPPFITGFHHSFAPRFDSFGQIYRRRLNHRNLSSRDEIRFTLRHHPGSQSAHSAEPTPSGIETARTTIPVTSVQRPIAFLIDGPPRT